MLLPLRATYLMFVKHRDLLLHLGQEQVYDMKILYMLCLRQELLSFNGRHLQGP